MDPASIFGITSTALSIALKIGSTVQRLNSLKSKFDSADIIIGSLTRKLTTIQHAIKNIRAWGDDVKEQPVPYSDEFQEALDTSINGCSEMLEALNVEISNIFSDGEANSWQKGKFLWKENLLKEYMGYMDGEVHALNLLLTSYQWYAVCKLYAVFANNPPAVHPVNRASSFVKMTVDEFWTQSVKVGGQSTIPRSVHLYPHPA